ncbi:hypothetical protein NOF55_05960 [Rhizobiaceae bacterium BDR2-2]|uniref:Uncharacterized protein n=1 Tax=Ectorhizobium quercum TaxID=2965071 RepID=A0AAE3MZN4_9HYPH|nr:hypothetical protein [Ectorhizobium quercum]MCX8996645.1 hypothetical protein [Ectorhizobium quercum]
MSMAGTSPPHWRRFASRRTARHENARRRASSRTARGLSMNIVLSLIQAQIHWLPEPENAFSFPEHPMKTAAPSIKRTYP